ncbi:MAG: hypothetical protein KAU46_04920 [Candidatus Aminicenantes bacterium]|nr:hypothetical protein [Candidatus Aminicenantes bacterium]
MKIKVASVNKNLEHDLINNITLDSAHSLTDFDVVIIDPKGFSSTWTSPASLGKITKDTTGIYYTDTRYDHGTGMQIFNIFSKRREEIKKLLSVSQGIVICYLRSSEDILNITHTLYGNVTSEVLNIYSWLPQFDLERIEAGIIFYVNFPKNINFIGRVGKEIPSIEQSHPFSKYFYAFKNQIHFECIIEPLKKMGKLLKAIAGNKVKEIISCEINIGGGKIIFIPPTISTDLKKETGVLLDCIEGVFEHGIEIPPPHWIKKYSLPNENKNVAKVEQLNKRISVLQKEKQNLEEEQVNIAKFKGLLYGKGKRNLEPLVREAFKLMGFNVIDPEQYEEEYDLYIKEKDLMIIGEIEGTDSSLIDIDKYRQLLDYVDSEIDKGVKCEGILIGNAYKDINPTERQEQFSQHAIKRCENQGFCRITTYQLFEIVKKIFSGIDGPKLEKLRKDIIECNTEFIFKKKENKKAQGTRKKK